MKPVGYSALVEAFRLEVLRPARTCFVRKRGSDRITRQEAGRVEDLYPTRYDPGEAWTDHLTFALKHEGVNLEILAALFRHAPDSELTAWVNASPTGRYTRLAWFLYEWLLERRLPLADLRQGNYFPVLDESE